MTERHGGCAVVSEEDMAEYFALINQFSPEYEGISADDISEWFSVQLEIM